MLLQKQYFMFSSFLLALDFRRSMHACTILTVICCHHSFTCSIRARKEKKGSHICSDIKKKTSRLARNVPVPLFFQFRSNSSTYAPIPILTLIHYCHCCCGVICKTTQSCSKSSAPLVILRANNIYFKLHQN